ncbi:Doublestranded RNAbinding protein Staufen -like protein 2like [Caligus rogercresseyi]|uniref:Doublestranded RNAbinding protein Staufen -like protein 2like n=1 Tax=Caligus rogercresseyi TaxID=217165 RepID=A0A7T8KBY0_CALRO|nr:Doublestranded RNAbinding protein Staufen -like protein 2like [Caligus rogercresseyi]
MNSSKRGGRYWAQKFPAWNYGCTLSNNSQTGAYETHVAQTQEQTEEKVEVSPPTPPAPSEDLEKPIQEILQGRNAIVFVNEQSKIRGLSMEWEQVAESGPPHLKVFSWSLKVGNTPPWPRPTAKSRQNKAAEDMARKLDALPKPKKRAMSK